jgi:hypothetical protein
MAKAAQFTFAFVPDHQKGLTRRLRSNVQLPLPALDIWDDPPAFHDALDLHMRRHGDTSDRLNRALKRLGFPIDSKTIRTWRLGQKTPNSVVSLKALREIEHRYGLQAGYLKAKLCRSARSARHFKIDGVSRMEQRRLAWHLPDDFSDRPQEEQRQIIEWVRRVIISGATDYRQYQAAALRHPYWQLTS